MEQTVPKMYRINLGKSEIGLGCDGKESACETKNNVLTNRLDIDY